MATIYKIKTQNTLSNGNWQNFHPTKLELIYMVVFPIQTAIIMALPPQKIAGW